MARLEALMLPSLLKVMPALDSRLLETASPKVLVLVAFSAAAPQNEPAGLRIRV